MKKSPKEYALEKAIKKELSGNALKAATLIFKDPEIHAVQEHANIVSIKRLGYNDHGPVHMRMASLNAIRLCNLLIDADIKLTLQEDLEFSADDSMTAVVIASLLHDLGMSIARDSHEMYSITLALPYIDKVLCKIYPDKLDKRIALRSTIIEGIAGHMATKKIHSLEAGLVLIGDGCDMEKGRARIPSLISNSPKVGDIHRYSSSSVEHVTISKGENKPIRITVEMSASVGFFQIEEVLFPKISSSPVKPYIELIAGVIGKEPAKYL